MPTICSKCRTVRPANATVPDWQCPACGVAYAKAGGDASAVLAVQRARAAEARQASSSAGSGGGLLSAIPWGKLIAAFFICYGGWVGYSHVAGKNSEQGGFMSRTGSSGKASGAWTDESLRALAQRSKSSDVIFYTAPWCPYCRAAHQWLDQYGFKYERCDIEASSDCKSQLQQLDSQGGVPYFIVKGTHMKDGFDAAQMLAMLAKVSP